MKSILSVLLMFVLTLTAIAQESQTHELAVPLSKPNETGTLEVSLIFGSIKVTGTKGKEVQVKATAMETRKRANVKENIVSSTDEDKKAATRDEMSKTSGLKRIPNTSLNLSVTEQNNTVQVSNGSVTRPVYLEIQVPQNFSLKLSTINNGDIVISNVNGDFELENVNGSIVLENVSGSAIVNTTNGKVKANFLQWNSKNPMAFSTLNGHVDVTLPANSKFNVKLDSDRGEIYTDFDVQQVKTAGASGGRTASGVYKVSVADGVTGKVNGGGPEIMLKNMNGNIYLRKK